MISASAGVSRYPFLDRLAGRHPVSAGQGGPCAADQFTSDIGIGTTLLASERKRHALGFESIFRAAQPTPCFHTPSVEKGHALAEGDIRRQLACDRPTHHHRLILGMIGDRTH